MSEIQREWFAAPSRYEKRATLGGPGDRYRYDLTRRWDEGELVNWIMLNPSKADESIDDPTVRRCMGYARAWGYGGIVITNLFALRATDPAELRSYPMEEAIGPENDTYLARWAQEADLIVCGWGVHGHLHGRDNRVLVMLDLWGITPHYIGLTLGGQPAHPLYLRADLRPVPLEGPR